MGKDIVCIPCIAAGTGEAHTKIDIEIPRIPLERFLRAFHRAPMISNLGPVITLCHYLKEFV